MKILIADDRPAVVEEIKAMTAEILPEAELLVTGSPSEVLPLCREHGFDVILMDIEPEVFDGISLAKKVHKKFPRTNIIYITDSREYAFESYSTHASGYLLKPVDKTLLKEALDDLRYPVSDITDSMLAAQNLSGTFIGMKIRKCREERGISRAGMAEALGCVISTVARWENGTRVPDLPTLMSIAKALGVRLDELMK